MWIASKSIEGKKTNRTYKEAAVRGAQYIEFLRHEYPAMTDAEMEAMLEGAQFAVEELLSYMFDLEYDYPNRDVWNERKKWEQEFSKGSDLMFELFGDEA